MALHQLTPYGPDWELDPLYLSSRFPELTGDESGDVADNEHSSDDGESDQESKCEVAASENPDSSKGDMAEFESLEALAALRASKMMLEDGDDSSD